MKPNSRKLVKEQSLEAFFAEHAGILRARTLTEAGLTYYTLRKLLQTGRITRIKRGVYRWNEGNSTEMAVVKTILPTGVLCLQSAALLHDYTTGLPLQYHVAVHKKSKHTLPEKPRIKLYYWQKSQLELGISTVQYHGSEVRVYDREKTVCDYLKFRSKLETGAVKEVLHAYLSDPLRNLARLKQYAVRLRISTVLDRYLETIL